MDGDGAPEVVTVGADTPVHCISAIGEKKWTCSIGDEAAGLVLLPRGIAAASLTGDVHLLSGTGERLWRRSLGSPCTALAAAGSGLCAATEAGDLVWLDAATGEPRHWLSLSAPAEHLLGEAGGSVLAATADGGLLRVAPAG